MHPALREQKSWGPALTKSKLKKSSKNLVLYFKGSLKASDMRLELKSDFSPEDGSVDYNVPTAIEFIEELIPIFSAFPSF